MVSVLYEDNHLLVVEKPPNMPTQADASGDEDLLSLLKEYIKVKYDKPGAVYLGLVHRLDRPVGGVMVFARTSKAAKRLSEQFQSHKTQKKYVAVVEGDPAPGMELVDYLQALENEIKVKVKSEPFEGGKKAALRFHTIARANGRALMDVELLTGRKHQIRAQLAAHGWPILFDQRYNPTPTKGQIALWAYSLTFCHPTTGEELSFYSLPKNDAFAEFQTQLSGLPASRAGYVQYADEFILVADKKQGVEVARADANEASLQAALENCFSPLYPVHRLDANTKGLVLFARDEKTKATLDEQIKNHKIQKFYRCKVLGKPSPEKAEHIFAHARKDPERGLLIVKESPFPGSAIIKTGYRVLSFDGRLSLLEVRLYTGRTHQIRAHMAFIGHPVLGDDKYGDREQNRRFDIQKQELIAAKLVLPDKREFRSSWEKALD
ncbi:RNA pseudouridine synthase [Eubacteriales bacterium OttesenSCG-928-K08]|nr:RNA pseudouridine synthase [Eubacteriales bacterium OttesenSCG-928-K08]